MKVLDILEARYHSPSYVGWADSIIHNKTHSRRDAVKSVPLQDVDQLIRDFKKTYGVPFVSNKDSDGLQYYMWEGRPEEGPFYNIIFWPHNGDLFVNMSSQNPVQDPSDLRMFEAKLSNKYRLEDFRLGDKIIITSKMKHGIERRGAEVRHIDHGGYGLVGYRGRQIGDHPQAGQGSFDPKKVGSHPYGKQHIEIVSRRRQYGKIREAKYYGDHAIAGIIKGILSRQERAHQKVFGIEAEELDEVVAAISRNFGEPRSYSEHSFYWRAMSDDGNAYVLDIGFAEHVFPTYQLTIEGPFLPKKK